MTSDKPSVLFVDRDQNILDGLRRLVRSQRLDWLTYCATTPQEALELIVTFPIDVIIVELNLPPIYGDTLLKFVQKAHPAIVRMVLSAEADTESELLLQSTQAAHQFLAKPCKIELLAAAVTRALKLRNLLRHPGLLRIIGGIPNLPSLPHLYHELVRELESDVASLDRIGDIISKDVSMTARLLQLVNSAFFGLPRKVSSPKEAAALLGTNIIKSLVLYVRLFFTAPDLSIPGLSLDEMWAHSSSAAVLAREIVRAEGGSRRMMEDAMLAGMMHDFGKLLVMDAEDHMKPVIRRVQNGETFADAEYAEFSTSHAEIGGYLLGLWGFPDHVVEAVACHHRPTQLHQGEFSPLTAVHVANAILNTPSEPAFDTGYLEDIGMKARIPDWTDVCRHQIGEIRK